MSKSKKKIHGVKIRCPHCNKYFAVIMPIPPLLIDPQIEEDGDEVEK